jgi:hypothetical protein
MGVETAKRTHAQDSQGSLQNMEQLNVIRPDRRAVRRQHMWQRLQEHDRRDIWNQIAGELCELAADSRFLLITTPGDDTIFDFAFDQTRVGCQEQLYEQARDHVFGDTPIEWFWIVDLNTNRGRKLRFKTSTRPKA